MKKKEMRRVFICVMCLVALVFLSLKGDDNDHRRTAKASEKPKVKPKISKRKECYLKEKKNLIRLEVTISISIKDEVKKDKRIYDRDKFLKVFKEYGLIEVSHFKVVEDFGIWDFIEFWKVSGEKKENLDLTEYFKRDGDFFLTLKDYKKYKPSDFDEWDESQVDKLYDELDKIREDIIKKIEKDDRVKDYIRSIYRGEVAVMVSYEWCLQYDDNSSESEKEEVKNKSLRLFSFFLQPRGTCKDPLCSDQWNLGLVLDVVGRLPGTGKRWHDGKKD